MRPTHIQIFGSSFTGGASPPPSGPTITRSAEGGSLYFPGGSSYLNFPGSSDWAVGTGDYTVEWWQWLTTSAQNPRPFSIGSYPSASFAVSLEGGTFYLWGNSGITGSAAISNYQDQWVHFAVARQSNTTSIYQNGNLLNSFADNKDITDSSTNLTIGNEGSQSTAGVFLGWLTNFRWTKGQAIYTIPFTPPQQPLSVGPNTKLLLLAETSGSYVNDSTGSNTSNGNSVVWQPMGPYAQRAWVDAGNVASYTDPSSTWYDLTPYGNNVTLTNAAYNSAVGGYLSFGTVGGAVFSTNPALINQNKAPGAAITMWINAADNTGWNFIAGLRGNSNFNFYFLLLDSSNTTEARVTTTSGSFDINVSYNSYYNTWAHVCFTVNGDRSELYINGALVGSRDNIVGTWTTAPADFTIARESGGGNQTQNLNMAMFRYHTRSRTAAEILAEFTAEQSRFGV